MIKTQKTTSETIGQCTSTERKFRKDALLQKATWKSKARQVTVFGLINTTYS